MPFAEDAGAVPCDVDPVDGHGTAATAECALEHRSDIAAEHVEAVARRDADRGNGGPTRELRFWLGRVRRFQRELKGAFELRWKTRLHQREHAAAVGDQRFVRLLNVRDQAKRQAEIGGERSTRRDGGDVVPQNRLRRERHQRLLRIVRPHEGGDAITRRRALDRAERWRGSRALHRLPRELRQCERGDPYIWQGETHANEPQTGVRRAGRSRWRDVRSLTGYHDPEQIHTRREIEQRQAGSLKQEKRPLARALRASPELEGED